MAWLEKIGETGHGMDPYLVAQSLEVTPLSLKGRERPSGAGRCQQCLVLPLTMQNFSREGGTVGAGR